MNVVRPTMVIMFLANLVNVLSGYLLIVQFKLGVEGAAGCVVR